MKSVIFLALMVLSTIASAGGSDVGSAGGKVQIVGDAAKDLFFGLENSGANLDLHTGRFTMYSLKNVSCVAETNIDSKETAFTCNIDLK